MGLEFRRVLFRSAKITVTTVKGATTSVTIKVQKAAVKVTKVTVSNIIKNKITIKQGKNFTLKPVVTPLTSSQKVTYSTNKKSVATVTSKGKIKAIKKGIAKITVKSESKKVVLTVTVK